MVCQAQTLVNKIEDEFSDISGCVIKSGNTVFLGDVAEGGMIDGLPACNYYGYESNPKERIWELGVHRKLKKLIEDAGWFVVCYDPGTYFAYKG